MYFRLLLVHFLCVVSLATVVPARAGVSDYLNLAILLAGGTTLEKALGAAGSQSLEAETSVDTDPALNARASNIVNRILSKPGARRDNLSYVVKVLNKREVNAYALPGGHVYVNSGLLELPGVSDDEVAYILGHELAHTNKGHGVKQLKEKILATLLLGKFSKKSDLAFATELGAQLYIAGRSQKDELEADAIGFDYMAAAGYDAAGGLTFMRRLETLSRGKEDPFKQLFSTHPPSSKRADILKSKMLVQEYGSDFKPGTVITSSTSMEKYSGPARDKIGLLETVYYLGDDKSGEKTVWSKNFFITRDEAERCTSAKVKFQLKAIPRKDPIVSINRQEIGRAVAKSIDWEQWEFPLDPKLLRGDEANLIDMETFIPDMWQSYDDCEIKHVWLVITHGNAQSTPLPPRDKPTVVPGFRLDVPFLSQCDTAEKSHIVLGLNPATKRGGKDPKAYRHSIATLGCKITSLAMVLNYYGGRTDPISLNAWLIKNGGYEKLGYLKYGSGTVLVQGVTYAGPFKKPSEEIRKELDSGYPVLLHTKGVTKDGHWVVATGYGDPSAASPVFYVNDPQKTTAEAGKTTVLADLVDTWEVYRGAPPTR